MSHNIASLFRRITSTTLLCLGINLATSANAEIVGANKIRFGNEADFGSGAHTFGMPGFGSVIWDYTVVNDVVQVRGRVRGNLYIDKLGPGCGRLRVNFQDRDFNNLPGESTTVQFCGPGYNANAAANIRAIDISSSSDPRIRRVQLVIGAGSTPAEIEDDAAEGLFSPAFRKFDIINNGTADIGVPAHALGRPLNPASISMVLQANGQIRGSVGGVLFMDSTNAGCSRLIIDFRDRNSATLQSRTVNECANAGGNAMAAANQNAFNVSFTNPSIFEVRMRLGRTVNNQFVGNVATRTYSFRQ